MSRQLDTYQLDTVKRRKAELEAQLRVIEAQRSLSAFYYDELNEIDAFLAAVEEAQAHE